MACLRSKTKIRSQSQRLAAIAFHTQRLMDNFSIACNLTSLTTNQKKTLVLGQATPMPVTTTINGKNLEVIDQFQYLGSTATDTQSFDTEINKRIGKASTILAKLSKWVWENKHLIVPNKVNAYQAYVISTLLYDSESWTTCAHQERKLQVFHMRCLCRILGIIRQVAKKSMPSLYSFLRQRSLSWLGYVHRMGASEGPHVWWTFNR